MTPHEQMFALDKKGETYRVRLGASGVELPVFSHSEKWLQVLENGRRRFYNLRHVGYLEMVTP